MATITELNENVREIINNPRIRCVLLEDAGAWKMLCSCLNVIGDTELALDAFLRQTDCGDNGTNYLLIYGALQVLFVQQDAVSDLAKALKPLNVTYERSELLKEIREIRSDSIGHPTKRDLPKKDGPGPSNLMVRMSLSHRRFDLVKNYEDGRTECLDVDIVDLIQKQRANLAATLTSIADKLKEDDMKHRRKFKHEKLQDIFSPTIDYEFEQIYKACDEDEPLALPAIKITFGNLGKFKAALQVRGILQAYDSVVDDLDMTQYTLSELKKFIQNSPGSVLNDKSAYIFAYFARKHIDALLEAAKEIDREYASENH
jgi:hypothetical protein